MVCSALALGALGVLVVSACVGDDPAVATTSGEDASRTTEDAAIDALPPNDAPADQAVPQHAIQIVAGSESACALLSDRTVWCWGTNAFAELGAPVTVPDSAPRQVQGLDSVASISFGSTNVCAVKMDGTVWCWGRNTEGELGRAPTDVPACGVAHCTPVPTQIPGLLASQVFAGGAFACAIAPPRSEVTCWGRNLDGQTGSPASPTALPTVVPGLANVVRMKLGYLGRSVCAVDNAGLVWCWGKNDRGQLGHTPGALSDISYSGGFYNPVPQRVTMEADGGGGAFDHVTDVVVTDTVCAARDNGTVWCWGRNSENDLNLANADELVHPKPVQIAPISGAISVHAGRATCALVDGGAPWCWGADIVAAGGGQARDAGCIVNTIPVPYYAPAPVPGPALASLSINAQLAFGLTLAGGVPVAWGSNTLDGAGRLGHPPGTAGDDDAGLNPTPTPVIGLP
ncbi:MAG: regulator of chromosome condensation [Myxococcaceae bacterium]|nr:regulator of chromosome condensation [Myxococcaceae bacterium]MEA2747437.1 hypothetical protein [Myxococcales bacterium]